MRSRVVGAAIVDHNTSRIKVARIPYVFWHKWLINNLAVFLCIDHGCGLDAPQMWLPSLAKSFASKVGVLNNIVSGQTFDQAGVQGMIICKIGHFNNIT